MTQVLDRDGQRQAVLRQLTAPYFAPAGLDVWAEAIDRCVREGLEILGGRERAQSRNGDLVLVATGRSVVRVLELTGLTRVFEIHASRVAALGDR